MDSKKKKRRFGKAKIYLTVRDKDDKKEPHLSVHLRKAIELKRMDKSPTTKRLPGI